MMIFWLTVLSRGWRRRQNVVWDNTSTFVPDGRSQHLCCFLPIIRCTFGSHLDVTAILVQIYWISKHFPYLVLGKMAFFDQQEPLQRTLKTRTSSESVVCSAGSYTNC